MKSRAIEAKNKKASGKYNCAQAVACTYCDLVNVDETTMANINQGFMVGMGNMEASCGALAGAAIILGLYNQDQRKTFGDARKLITEFKEQNQSVICKELKGVSTGNILRECNDCVYDAAKLLEEIIDFENI